MTADRRLLLVHAHPDDETINNGATMARYAAEGARVTLVTCTRGEMGEILVPELAHLGADAEDRLGPHREGELAAAMAALGVRDHRFLGAPAVRYRDSGMAYAEDGSVVPVADPRPGSFALAPVEEAAALLAGVIREVRPQAVVTYEPGGGYGHPDHVQAHRVTTRAIDLAEQDGGEAGAVPGWRVPKFYWTVMPRSQIEAVLQDLRDSGEPLPEGIADRLPSMVVPDAEVTTRIDADAYVPAKTAALVAHATQLTVGNGRFSLGQAFSQPVLGTEYYRLVRGEPAGQGDGGLETDLFAGV